MSLTTLLVLRTISGGGFATCPHLAPLARQAVTDGLATHCPIRCAFALTEAGLALVLANSEVEIPWGVGRA